MYFDYDFNVSVIFYRTPSLRSTTTGSLQERAVRRASVERRSARVSSAAPVEGVWCLYFLDIFCFSV